MNDEMQPYVLGPKQLERVSGGMTCDQALTSASVYMALGDFYQSLGMHEAAGEAYGKASWGIASSC